MASPIVFLEFSRVEHCLLELSGVVDR
jgi:hypothetical protein